VIARSILTGTDPTMHGEITAIRHCTEVLRSRGLAPADILRAWKDFSLYTNGEPCPMCASAIRWAGFKEVIYGSSIKTIAKRESSLPTDADVVDGRNQIYVPASFIWEKSYSLGHATLMYAALLTIRANVQARQRLDQRDRCLLRSPIQRDSSLS
jgi:tRNA(Arg) A34 adenosine deaminase TadA